ncbi:hypothetical protein E1B28_006603 [Marasmius oreades]|uniref:Uncharacterized protein n=1 Tax=Marasmius oreades TaxID=181124 RepID=A0A9P7UWG7_9AGAR|nr:uncharacterized protein E1B28_006603 [Marasmius oreades]KAG7095919.1 hypothetical protein E1B28_006603 [Marasmius oreades]
MLYPTFRVKKRRQTSVIPTSSCTQYVDRRTNGSLVRGRFHPVLDDGREPRTMKKTDEGKGERMAYERAVTHLEGTCLWSDVNFDPVILDVEFEVQGVQRARTALLKLSGLSRVLIPGVVAAESDSSPMLLRNVSDGDKSRNSLRLE